MDPIDNKTELLLFFQHFEGDIRFSQLRDNAWTGGGTENSIGAKNPANGTSITAASYSHQGVLNVIARKELVYNVELMIVSMSCFILTNHLRSKTCTKTTKRTLGQQVV